MNPLASLVAKRICLAAKCSALCDQVRKCIRRMPWQLVAMKDVGACDKPRVVGKQTLIRGFPNGETRLIYKTLRAEFIGVLKQTRRTETSKYPEEKISTDIP